MGIPRNYVPKSQLSIGLEEVDLTQPNQKISQPSSKKLKTLEEIFVFIWSDFSHPLSLIDLKA